MSAYQDQKETLKQEQLAFYADQEEKCRKTMKFATRWAIATAIICFVLGTFCMFSSGVVAWLFIYAGIGIFGILAFGIVGIIASRKLEKIQRERLFHMQ